MRTRRDRKKYFKEIFNSLDQETRLLVKQKLYLQKTNLWNKICWEINKNEEANPKEWLSWKYGHVAIKLTKRNKCFAKKSFEINNFGIVVSVGLIRELGNKQVPGMHVIWNTRK